MTVTCCGIEDFLEVREEISGYIIYLSEEKSYERYKNIHISTINREDSEKKELKIKEQADPEGVVFL